MLFSTLTKLILKSAPSNFFFFFFRETILSHFTFYAIFNIKKKYCHLLVKWEVVSPNSRWGCHLKSQNVSLTLIWSGSVFHNIAPWYDNFSFPKFNSILSHFTFYAIFNIKKINIEKCPFKFPGGGGGGGGVLIFFFREKQILSHFMFYAIFNIKKMRYILEPDAPTCARAQFGGCAQAQIGGWALGAVRPMRPGRSLTDEPWAQYEHWALGAIWPMSPPYFQL